MFCPKCGTQMTEEGKCPRCNPVQPEVNAEGVAPVISGTLTKSAWFVPVALLVSSVVTGIISGVINSIFSAIASGTGEYVFSYIGSAVTTLLTAVITLGVIWVLYGVAFKTVSPKEKTVCSLIMLLPLALLWLRNMISSVLSSLMFAILPIKAVSIVSSIISLVITIVFIVLSYIVAQKILAAIENTLK